MAGPATRLGQQADCQDTQQMMCQSQVHTEPAFGASANISKFIQFLFYFPCIACTQNHTSKKATTLLSKQGTFCFSHHDKTAHFGLVMTKQGTFWFSHDTLQSRFLYILCVNSHACVCECTCTRMHLHSTCTKDVIASLQTSYTNLVY